MRVKGNKHNKYPVHESIIPRRTLRGMERLQVLDALWKWDERRIFIWTCDELLLKYISGCSSGLFGRVLSILTDTTLSYFIRGPVLLSHFDPFRSFLTSCCLLWFGTRPHGAEVWMWRLDMLLTSAVSFILLWQLLHGFLLSFLSYYPFLAICPSLPFSEVHFSLSSAPIPLPSPCHPDVNAFIMWNTCTPCWSLSPPLLCPSPFSGYCDYRVCVCLCVSARARREHTGCHRANICQGDLACQSWCMCVCVAKAGNAAVCRDKGPFPQVFFFYPPVMLCLSAPLCIVPFSLCN